MAWADRPGSGRRAADSSDTGDTGRRAACGRRGWPGRTGCSWLRPGRCSRRPAGKEGRGWGPDLWAAGRPPPAGVLSALQLPPPGTQRDARTDTYVQEDQRGRAHQRGGAQREHEAHGAPHAQADEDQRDQHQLLVGHGGGGGGAGLRRARLADGPVLGQRLVLRGGRTGWPEPGPGPGPLGHLRTATSDSRSPRPPPRVPQTPRAVASRTGHPAFTSQPTHASPSTQQDSASTNGKAAPNKDVWTLNPVGAPASASPGVPGGGSTRCSESHSGHLFFLPSFLETLSCCAVQTGLELIMESRLALSAW